LTEQIDDNGDVPILGDLAGAGKIITSEVAKKTYDDALSGPFKQLGALSTDLLKSIRLFTAPLQLGAAYQDRFAKFCERVREKVPEELQQDAAPEIAAPVMEAFATTSDDGPLMSMFEELMARAIDSREADKLSPEFPTLIRSLSPLEAKLIESLTTNEQYSDNIMNQNLIVQVVGKNFDFDEFGGFEHHLTLVQSLHEKKLVINRNQSVPNVEQLYPNLKISDGHKLKRSNVTLSMYGRWFASACISKPASPNSPK